MFVPRWFLLAMGGLALADAHAQAQTQYSADVSTQLGASFGHDHDYFLGTPNAIARIALNGLSDRVDLDALHIDSNFDVLVSLDVGATVGGVVAGAGDVLRRRGSTYSLTFDASANGLPEGVNCDAVARNPGGQLLLSFDRGFAVGGTYIRPADVVAFNGSTYTKLLDAQALGLPGRLNIDAVDAQSATVLLLSFDTGGTVGGVGFADEDILQLDLSGPTWSMRHVMLATSSRWGPANLDALAAALVGDGLFKDSFE